MQRTILGLKGGIHGTPRTPLDPPLTKILIQLTLGNCGILQATLLTYTGYIACTQCIKLTFMSLWALTQLLSKVTTVYVGSCASRVYRYINLSPSLRILIIRCS